MRFRPLCIDYHARAQEIIITESDYNSRRAAQSLLSHRHAEDRMDDEDESPRHHDFDDDLFVLNDEDGENRKPSSNSVSNGHDEKYPVDNSPSKSNDRHATRQEGSNANAPRSSANGILSIIALLGPAIHPSECALRSVSPVTRGPIRGRILPVDGTIPAMECIEMHAKIGKEQFQRDISSLGGGESRQQSFIDDASMFLQSRYSTVEHPMQIMDEKKSNNPAEDGNDTIELTRAPSELLRHEPEDLTKIQSLKSLQMMTNFSSEVINQMEPRQRKSSSQSLHLVCKEKQSEADLSAEPKLSFMSCEMTEVYNNDFALNKNVLSLTSFFDDCHGGLADYGTNACPILQSRKLKSHSKDKFFMIRLDPDFDPLICQSTSRGGKMDSAGLVRSLQEICSADFISQELSLPRRLEHKHDDQIALTLRPSCCSDHRIEFVEKALSQFQESQMRDEALLSPFVQRDLLVRETTYFPKTITLESDLSLYDDDFIEPMPSYQPNAALDLPSFAQSLPFSCARKTTHRSKKLQKRFVESSARVCKIDTLSNICGPSKVACLYLPQIEVCDWKDKLSRNESLIAEEEQQHLASNDDLISFVRSCVPSSTIPDSIDLLDGVDLLQGQTSSYPILSWFTCDDDIDGSDLIDPDEIDTDALMLKRKTFCSNAVRVGDEERSRCVLFTGCSSRVNDGRKYSYRGFLSNQIVSPRVFQQRYKSMIELNKICQRENISALNKGSDIAFSPRQGSFYFSRMVVVDFADRFSAKMSKKKKVRRGPFAASLRTRRHGDLLPLQMKNKRIVVVSGQQFVPAPEIERLSSSFYQEKENINANDAVGQLGRENLLTELLHLVTKAHELREEEDAYLAELAVINRGASFDDEICDMVDVATDSYANENGKRASYDIAMEEHDKEKKKKRKKDKKKKEKKKMKKEKKSHKRKRRGDVIDSVQADAAPTKQLVGDGCDPSSKIEESKLQSTSVKKLRIDEAVPSTNRKPWKAVPSIELGITPIHRPKEKRSQTQPTVQVHETPKMPDKCDRLNTNSTSHSLSSLDDSSSGKSPDSVAVADLAHGALFTETNPNVPTMMQSQASNKSEHIFSEQERDNISAIDNNIDGSTESYDYGISSERASEDKLSPFTILTSESFLEQFGESILELASGRWFNTLTAVERLHITSLLNGDHESVESGLDPGIPTQAKINVCDCPLLDVAGADIELADDKALIVQRISELNSVGGNKEFIRRLVFLAASGRYRTIHVILCVDTDIRPSEIVMMQNALSGCPCENVSFEYTSPRTLSSSIALQFCISSEVHKSSRISQFASDENVQERARFLICLVPTMTVHNALRCLYANSEDDGGATAMQTLFTLARDTSRELFPHKVTSMMPKACAEQLWLAVKVAASYAST